MTSDPEGNPAGDAINPDENELVAEAKPKARKKKASESVEASVEADLPQAASQEPPDEVTSEEVTPGPAKKTKAKKAKPVAEPMDSAEAPITEEPTREPLDAAEMDATEDLEESEPASGPEPKLERLQKILAKAGISSRRKAEELILGGKVQINGKVVMELGTKADPARDHVRVEGKLLHGPERIRYFVLNKPKGYVTTVSDPEGRPTVMQFFASERERLYPVGRLDYLSEGLLLVTNDGELANKLTKASSGVEKTYLVKVAGQPGEEALDALREGVVIERGRPGTGSGRVRTAPAKIRQVRQGDNPWYEVIIIEGRNRELRKMFEEIGHHVEKIRRVGYGPLILDLEPGKLRELEPEEVQSLRLASEGKLKTRRRRGPAPAQLPTVAGKTVRYKKADGKPGFEPRPARDYTKEFSKEPKPEFKAGTKPGFKSGPKPIGRPEFKSASGASFKPGFKSGGKPEFGNRPGSRPGNGPGFAGKPRRAEPPVTDYVLPPRKAGPVEPELDDRPSRQRSDFNPDYKPGFRTGAKPAFRSDRPGKPTGAGKPFRPTTPRADFVRPAQGAEDDDFVPRKTPGFRIEPVGDKPRATTPRSGGFDRRPQGKPFRPAAGRPASGERPFRPQSDRPAAGSRPFRPRTDGPPSGDRGFRPRQDRGADRGPARNDGEARPFRPRPDRPVPDRPVPDRPATGRSFARPSGARPSGDRASGPAAGGRPFRAPARPAGNRPGTGRSDSGSGEFRPRREFRPGGDARTGAGERPARFTPRGDGPPSRGSRPARPSGAGDERPREFRPRTGSKPAGGAAKKPFGAKPTAGGRSGAGRPGGGKPGAGGEPRIKERWRNSFTGKNKGRPKPKPRSGE